jgi:hypothetical protein
VGASRGTWRRRILITVTVVALSGSAGLFGWAAMFRVAMPTGAAPVAVFAMPSPSPSPSPSRTLIPDAAIPKHGAGTFTGLSTNGPVLGSGRKLIKYHVEVEQGIDWGSLTPWTTDRFAASVDSILADPRGWTLSAQHPVTNADVHLDQASWRFQRVGNGSYDVRIRLATQDTVDEVCRKAGIDIEGVHSCTIGNTIMINMRRWVPGVEWYATLDEYHANVINHEVGHFLGFNHMKCPGPGQPAPIMAASHGQCLPNPYPFGPDGTFISGPWEPS